MGSEDKVAAALVRIRLVVIADCVPCGFLLTFFLCDPGWAVIRMRSVSAAGRCWVREVIGGWGWGCVGCRGNGPFLPWRVTWPGVVPAGDGFFDVCVVHVEAALIDRVLIVGAPSEGVV